MAVVDADGPQKEVGVSSIITTVSRVADGIVTGSIFALGFALGVGRDENTWPLIALSIAGLTLAIVQAVFRRRPVTESAISSAPSMTFCAMHVALACTGIWAAAAAWL